MPSGPADIDVLIAAPGRSAFFSANECARRGLSARIVGRAPGSPSTPRRSPSSRGRSRSSTWPASSGRFSTRRTGSLGSRWSRTAGSSRTCDSLLRRRRTRSSRWSPRTSPRDCSRRRCGDRVAPSSIGRRSRRPSSAATAWWSRSITTADAAKSPRRSWSVDGAHSAVRHLLNLSFEGAQYEDLFLLADVETNDALPSDELCYARASSVRRRSSR